MNHKARAAWIAVTGALLLAGALAWLLSAQRGAPGSLLPHGYCFTWNPALLWTHVLSDSLIGLAYMSIPLTLLHLVHKRGDLPFDWIILLFAVFIVSCGVTHLIEVWTVWQPDYWLSAMVKVVTAMASLLTAAVLIRLMPRILAIPTVEQLRSAKLTLEAEVARRVQVEATLLQERNELELRVRQRTEALERANADARAAHAQAEQANQLKDRFLAQVAHELRTPLQASLSWAQVLQRVVDDPVRAAAAAERVVVQTQAQARMIDDLLDLSRVLSGKLGLHPAPVSAADVLHSAVEVVRAAHPGRSLEVDVSDQDSGVLADPLRLEQVFWNLLNNALQATAGGGFVHVSCLVQDDRVVVTVQDSGRGIDPAELAHVFEPFRQGQPGGGEHRGLGLGLAIAHNIVGLSGGELQAHSDGLGRGARFTVRLPHHRAADADTVGTPAHAVKADASLQGLRLLYVENDPDIADGVRRMLQALGITVELCTRHDEALQRLAQREFDLLLCDLQLDDGHTATDLLRQVRADARHRRMPALVLSAHGSVQDRRVTAAAGFAMHLVKPVDMHTLQRVLSRLHAAASH